MAPSTTVDSGTDAGTQFIFALIERGEEMKVYLVERYWNNCEGYPEDFCDENKVLGVFHSEEKAKTFMENYSVDNKWNGDVDTIIDKDISGLEETFGKMRYTRVVHLISRGGRYESEDEYVLYISEWEVE